MSSSASPTRRTGEFRLRPARGDVEGWRLRGMRVEPWGTAYSTNFGDPAATEPLSRYSAIRAVLDIERTDWTGFAKLTAALYAAFLLCVIGCLVPVDSVSFSPRVT